MDQSLTKTGSQQELERRIYDLESRTRVLENGGHISKVDITADLLQNSFALNDTEIPYIVSLPNGLCMAFGTLTASGVSAGTKTAYTVPSELRPKIEHRVHPYRSVDVTLPNSKCSITTDGDIQFVVSASDALMSLDGLIWFNK